MGNPRYQVDLRVRTGRRDRLYGGRGRRRFLLNDVGGSRLALWIAPRVEADGSNDGRSHSKQAHERPDLPSPHAVSVDLGGDGSRSCRGVVPRRNDRAMAKLEAPTNSAPRRTTGMVTAALAEPSVDRPVADAAVATQIQVLVCAECEVSFERVRVRGRKPRLCPDCRQRAV